MDLFKEYLKERENKEVIENEYGFIIYKLFDKECFIADFYIKPAFRNTIVLPNFIDQLAKIAKSSECDHISAKLYIADNGHQKTLMAAFKMGFNILSTNNDCIIIIKKLGGS